MAGASRWCGSPHARPAFPPANGLPTASQRGGGGARAFYVEKPEGFEAKKGTLYMKNVWANFFEHARLNWKLTRNSSPNEWRIAIEHSVKRRTPNPMLCLLALSWYEATHGEPLVFDPVEGDRSVVNISQKLGFSYSVFTNHRDDLRKKFESMRDVWGFRLLQTTTNQTTTCQYLRTIHRYSGVVFLKTAEQARKLTPSKWLVGKESQELNDHLREVAARYADRDEKEQLIADVRDFWGRMAKRYRLYNAAPSLDRCAAEEGDIPISVLTNILQVLWPEQEGKEEVVNDSVPVFRLDTKGRPALGLPNNPKFSADGNVNLICFVCRDKEENLLKSIRFHLSDGAWQAEQADDSVPLVSVGRVVRREFEAKTGSHPKCISEQDVTPSALADSDYILFSSHNGQIKPVDLETPLNIGQRYIIAPLSGEMPGIQALDDSETATTVPTDSIGALTIPNDAVSIQIGDNQYSVKTAIFEWIDIDRRFQNIRNPGARLFFTQGTHLLTDSWIENESIGVRYLMSGGAIVDLPELAKGEVPDAILWNRGKLAFFDLNTQERVASRATTFLPPIEARELGVPMELQHVDPAHVRIGNVQIEVSIPDWCDKVDFTHQGVTFRFPLQRQGITMKLPTKDELVELQSHGHHLTMQSVVVARDDFVAAAFSFLLPDQQREDGALEVDRGMRENRIARFEPIPKRLRGNEIRPTVALNLRGDNERRRFTTWTFDGKAMVGDIVLYSPEQEDVCQIREGADLVCKLSIAWRWSQRQLLLVCFPGHRLDEQPTILDADMAEFVTQAGMNLQATLRFSGFFERQDFDWGPGLHAFIARRDKTRSEGMATITPMFFIHRPTELGQWDGNCPDGDPFGLRKAMAQNELAAIDEIMHSGNEECREYVRQFETRTFTAWNSINCVKSCPAYKEGYFFMADWWLHETALSCSDNYSLVGRMNENYRSLWNPLLTTRVNEAPLSRAMQLNAYLPWLNIHQFNEPGCAMVRKTLGQLFSDVKSYIQETDPDFHAYKMDPTFIHNEELVPLQGTLYNQCDFEKCLSRLGRGVAIWRRDPTCQAAQRLRDLLLRAEDLDASIEILVPSIGPQGRPDRLGMVERIALKAFAMRKN